MKTTRWTLRATRMLLTLNAAFWLGFGILVIAGWHPALPSSQDIQIGMGVLAFCLAFALSALTRALPRSQPAFYALLVLLGTLALSTFFDQFGLADLVYLLLTLALIGLLVWDRHEYIPSHHPRGS